ncbi:uncharacterized protein JCM10292_005043 [Rhodotorula paludigena]|uniref:uncharacterized protein n=1 Tax=Rhodotorula paludigena TaxID=86838 RepID=UPI003177FF5B
MSGSVCCSKCKGNTVCLGCFGATGVGRYNVELTLEIRPGNGRKLVEAHAQNPTLQGLSDIARRRRGRRYRPGAVAYALRHNKGSISALSLKEWAIVQEFLQKAVKELDK